jgi:hypothetical protein
MEIFSIALKYLFSDYRVKFEKETDQETIGRGLGWQLLEFARYNREHKNCSPKLIRWLNKYYLSREEIEKYL